MPTTIAEQVNRFAETTAAQPPNEIMGAFTREQTDLGAWCPYCNIALNTYQAELVPELSGRGVKLVAISPQTPDGSLSTVARNELTFTVLSDPGNQIATAVGILTGPSDEARAAQLRLGLDLTAVNADGTTGLPMPTTVIVDAHRVVRWIDVHPDYTTRSEPGEILAALDAAAPR